MNINIINAVYCLRHDSIVSLKKCKFGMGQPCPFYKRENNRSDGIRELICSYVD